VKKTFILGPFATGSDVVAVHGISKDRREWLDTVIKQVSDKTAISPKPKLAHRKAGNKKSAAVARAGTRQKRASKVVTLRDKEK
jgi:hypothetical protein